MGPREADEKEITRLLRLTREGDDRAQSQLMACVYSELHRLAARYLRRERPGHTLQTTALVHEAYLELVDQRSTDWQNRGHFLAVAAQAMRRILVDHARARMTQKRGKNAYRVEFDPSVAAAAGDEEGVLAVHMALDQLAELDPQLARVVEMRFFGGLTEPEIAVVLNISARTVRREWSAARAWLSAALRQKEKRTSMAAGGDRSR